MPVFRCYIVRGHSHALFQDHCNIMRKLPVFILLTAIVLAAYSWDVNEKYTGPKTPETDTTWHADILAGYEARYVNQGEAFDGTSLSLIHI